MPGVSLAHFFPGGAAQAALGPALAQAPPLPPANLLLFGPERSGKTTLLFHLAYSLAAAGAAVVIVGSRRVTEPISLKINAPRTPKNMSLT